MGLTVNNSVPVITVFLQGLISFFSPCVLPLLPLYIGYLSGGTVWRGENGERIYNRKKVILNTVFFVTGVAFAFFLLGLGLRAIGRFFSGNQLLFARIGGVIVICFGLYQLGIFGDSAVLARERRLPVNLDKMAMSPVAAFVMGFVFSFAWTPCVGPTLSSVLLMAASAQNSAVGFLLIGVYTAGFVIPFLLTGIFTTSLLSAFKRHRNFVRYTVRVGGILLVFMGVLMLTGHMNSLTGYLSKISGQGNDAAWEEAAGNASADAVKADDSNTGSAAAEDTVKESDADAGSAKESDADAGSAKESDADAGSAKESDTGAGSETSEMETADNSSPDGHDQEKVFPAPDFTLKDQYGIEHTLSDYRGKIVFLNFWATWCPPCRAEMPDIQKLYEENQAKEDTDLVILGVAFPDYGDEKSVAGISEFLEENGYTYPTVMNDGATLASAYYITAFPTTFMIDKEGNIFGYVPGSISKEIMEDIIQQTREG